MRFWTTRVEVIPAPYIPGSLREFRVTNLDNLNEITQVKAEGFNVFGGEIVFFITKPDTRQPQFPISLASATFPSHRFFVVEV